MSYLDQMNAWLLYHPDATQEKAYKAGYFQCTDNWCKKETFSSFKKTKENE